VLPAALLAACASTGATRTESIAGRSAADAESCFAIERLTPARQALARQVLLKAADGEALYTLAGSIKPVSSDFVQLRVRVSPAIDQALLDSVAEYQALLPALRCGDVGAFASPSFTAYAGRDTTTRERFISFALYDRKALRETITRHAEFFGTLGLVESSEPATVFATVEGAERDARWRGYGYLFGYPDPAIDFFIWAGLKADSIDRAAAVVTPRPRGHVEPRDFRRIETFKKFAECSGCPPTASSFVYAVPKGAPENAEDRALRERTAPIYAQYVARRARWVTPERNGIAELLREWMAESAPRQPARR
jgi:hypothetical protein